MKTIPVEHRSNDLWGYLYVEDKGADAVVLMYGINDKDELELLKLIDKILYA